jgi:hypothetical protein
LFRNGFFPVQYSQWFTLGNEFGIREASVLIIVVVPTDSKETVSDGLGSTFRWPARRNPLSI